MHRFIPLTETVHHDPVTHQVHHDEVSHTEWIADEEAWDEYVTEMHSFCSGCRADLTLLLRQGQIEDYSDHALEHSEKGEPAYGYRMEEVVVETIHHEAVGHEENVIDTPAWDETVIDVPAWDETVIRGYRCAVCGKDKEN